MSSIVICILYNLPPHFRRKAFWYFFVSRFFFSIVPTVWLRCILSVLLGIDVCLFLFQIEKFDMASQLPRRIIKVFRISFLLVFGLVVLLYPSRTSLHLYFSCLNLYWLLLCQISGYLSVTLLQCSWVCWVLHVVNVSMCLQETQRLMSDPVPGISAVPDEQNARYFHVVVAGQLKIMALDGIGA